MESTPGEDKPQAPRPCILLVEDYAPNVLVASTFLDEFGFDCDVAEDGEEAVEKVKQGTYALVLMDVQMHGMNGLEATKRIRDHESGSNRRTPIVGMTAHALSGDRNMCISAGMDDYVAKPFNPDDLRNKIYRLAGTPSEALSG